MKDEIQNYVNASTNLLQNLGSMTNDIEKSIMLILECLQNEKKIVLFGNGGSAADAQHIAAEFVGRFFLERKSLPALALTTDTSILTSISNDFDYSQIFSRQCESLVNSGDVAIGISTSGNSKNVIEGLLQCKKNNAKTIGLLGNSGGDIKDICDVSIIIPSSVTSHIQEAHRVVYHIICNLVERNISSS